MDPSDKPSTDTVYEGKPQPFVDFKTMPGGWDLSGQPTRNTVNRAAPADITDQQSDSSDDAACGDAPWQAQKFTKPRTIPTGWDTSALK